MPGHKLQSNLKFPIEQVAVLDDAIKCVALHSEDDSEDVTKKDQMKKEVISDVDLKNRRKKQGVLATANKLKEKIGTNGKKKYSFGLCLNPMYPYQLSKKAEQQMQRHCETLARYLSIQEHPIFPSAARESGRGG
ncbi:hypothetical protein SLE2022_057080 [Rubroshorea leprosula]